jgi:hypothetical protein
MVEKLSRFRIAFSFRGSTSQLLNDKNLFGFFYVARSREISIFFPESQQEIPPALRMKLRLAKRLLWE